jgi:hypothetical protein
MTAVIEVLVIGFTTAACWLWLPKTTSTVAPDWKFAPVIVICDPPETVPEAGERALRDGATTNV